jgi:hypothetical protein
MRKGKILMSEIAKRKLYSFIPIMGVMIGVCLLITWSNETNTHRVRVAQTITLPTARFPVTRDDVLFGQTQVDQMMRDRPQMGIVVKKGDLIYNWVARQFAGEAIGQRILWSPEFTLNAPSIAYHQIPYPPQLGKIAVRMRHANGAKKDQLIEGEELWAAVVFELFNIHNWKQFAAMDEETFLGQINKEEYLRKVTTIEFLAIKNIKQFYRDVWAPWAERKGISSEQSHWHFDAPESYDDWIKQYTDKNDYPYVYYGRRYDEVIIPYLKSKSGSP